MTASSGGFFDIVQFLYENCAPCNLSRANSHNGETPMFYACSQGRLDFVQWLCEHNCEQDIVRATPLRGSHLGTTPLFVACENNSLDIVTWVIEQGIPEPMDFFFDGLSIESRRELYQRAMDVRDVDHESFLTLAVARCCSTQMFCHVEKMPMGVLRLIGDFLRGTVRSRNVWGRLVGLGVSSSG